MPRQKHLETDCSSCSCVPRCHGGVCTYGPPSCSSSSSSSTSYRDCNPPISCDSDCSSSSSCDNYPRAKDLIARDPEDYDCPEIHHDNEVHCDKRGKHGNRDKCVDYCPPLGGKCKENPVVVDKCNIGRYLRGEVCSDSSSSSSSESCGPILVPRAGPGYVQNCEFVDKVSESSSSSEDECDLPKLEDPFVLYGDKKKHRRHHKKSRKNKCKVFHISFEEKFGHPWQHRIVGTDKCIAVSDGKHGPLKGANIHLTRNHYYKFVVEGADGLNFYLTMDPQGGPKGHWADSPHYDPLPLENTFNPITSGEVPFHASCDFPKSFYYQSKNYPCMGGQIFIHDK